MATFSLQVKTGAVAAPFDTPYRHHIRDYVVQPRRYLEMLPLSAVIARCNKFTDSLDRLFVVKVLDNSAPIGLMLPKFVEQMNWDNTGFVVSRAEKTVHLKPQINRSDSIVEACRKEFVELCEKNVDNFAGFEKWLITRHDYHPVRGVDAHLEGLKMPAPLRGILGIITTGVHMNMYSKKKVDGEDKIFVWVSKRTNNVTYAGKLDQVVAGAMDPEDLMKPMETLQREALEEAGLHISGNTVFWKDAVVGTAKMASTITFYDEKDHVAGCEAGHLEPGIRFTFDLEVHPSFVPTPTEPESIAGFFLKSADEVKEDLKNDEWKPNCGLVMLDFLLRHGELRESTDVESIDEIRKALTPQLPLRLESIPGGPL